MTPPPPMIWHKTFFVCVCVSFLCFVSAPPPSFFGEGALGGWVLVSTDLRGWSYVRIPLPHIVTLAQLLCQKGGGGLCRTAAYRHPSPNTLASPPGNHYSLKHIKQILAHVPVMNHFINSIVTNLNLTCDTQRGYHYDKFNEVNKI